MGGDVTAMAVTGDWLNQAQLGQACGGSLTASGNNTSQGYCGQYQDVHYFYHFPWTYQVVSSPARPIKLTLSEIERLRKLAKADDAVKAILAKFTDQIEIIVDFK